jgi:hypothetical protein
MPSLSPLSTLIRRRIRAATAGTIMPALRAASGRRECRTDQQSGPDAHPRRQGQGQCHQGSPGPIVSGSPIPGSRRHSPRSARRWCRPTREASENSTRASVASASTLTCSGLGVTPSGASGPCVSSMPAVVKTIGAVMSKRSSRAGKVPHTKISAAMIARSAAVTALSGWRQASFRGSMPGSWLETCATGPTRLPCGSAGSGRCRPVPQGGSRCVRRASPARADRRGWSR